MIDPRMVSAVVVTRGDVELTEILDHLADVDFAEVVVWQNGGTCWQATGREPRKITDAPDVAVYGRYAAIAHTRRPYVYVQDDDCIVNVHDLLREASEEELDTTIVANMPWSRWMDYPDSCLVGWGALFHFKLPFHAFGRFAKLEVPEDAWQESNGTWLAGVAEKTCDSFLRTCDVAFTTLTPHRKIDVGFHHLPWAEEPARAMFKQPNHKPERDSMYEIARAIRDA